MVTNTVKLRFQLKQRRDSLFWAFFCICLLCIIAYDLRDRCPFSFSKLYYIEYGAATILLLSLFYNSLRYVYYVFSAKSIHGDFEQRTLLGFSDSDSSFVTQTPCPSDVQKTDNAGKSPNKFEISSTWHSFNESRSSPWLRKASPQQNQSFTGSLNSMNNNSQIKSYSPPSKRFAIKDLIEDEADLQEYLKEYSEQEELQNKSIDLSNSIVGLGNSLNQFWSNSRWGDMSLMLKTSAYQLSPGIISPSKQNANDESSIFSSKEMDSEILTKLSSQQISQYVSNLRFWISTTILKRLDDEINRIDSSFKARGLSDFQIGNVALERLKKTAENQQLVSLYVPTLPSIIPFLEMSTNQDYLVKRIKALANGSCMADYRWNSGSSYKGSNWDDHLPTDAAIIFHLFCTYLDTQLMPLPHPGGRPFFNRYVVLSENKTLKEILEQVKNKSNCAILCSNSNKPKFDFVSDEKIHHCGGHNRNNLFYAIIQFLIYMKTKQDCCLDGVNLGRSGVNLTCIIED